MGLLRDATAVVLSVIGLAGLGMMSVALAQTPQSQCSVLSGRPCHPSFCGVFHRGPCLPHFEPPLGETLRLTIVSTDDDNLNDKPEAKEGEQKSADENVENNGSEDRKLD